MKTKRRLLLLASAAALVLVGLIVLIPRRHVQLYKVTVLPAIGLWRTWPKAINDRGQVAGFADVAVVGRFHLFIWDQDNGMKDLGPMDADDIDINNAGQITGTMTDPNGNKQAFEQLVRRYRTDAYLTALGFTGNSEDARDLSQEAFIKAHQARRRFDPSRPFYPWFYRILRNHCINFIQRTRRKHEPLHYEDQPERERFQSPGPTPLEQLEKEERKRLVRSAIERLSDEHREVIILKNFRGLSYKEIAAALDTPIGTVMSRLYYARRMLKEIILELEQTGVSPEERSLPQSDTAPGEVG